jgi:hypothetical protein
MKPCLPLLALSLALFAARSARAAEYGEPYLPDGARGLTGSVRWETLRQAAYTNANIFGAVGAYDRYFRPVIANVMRGDDVDDFFVFGEEMYYTSHIAYAPIVCRGVVYSDCENTVAELPFDQFSGGIAMGGGSRHYGLFLATSWSLTAPSHDLYAGAGLTPVMPLVTGWVLPFGEDTYASLFPGSIDGILAGYLNVGPVQASAGYVLSHGFFGDVNLPKLRAFVQALLTDRFQELGLFKSGFRGLSLPELVGSAKSTIDSIGYTAAYVRDAKLKPPNIDDIGEEPELIGRDFWTAHLEQWNIAEIFDVEGAYAFATGGFFHKGLVAIHTPDMPERASFSTSETTRKTYYDEIDFSAYASVGFVELPALWYYGVSGGRSLAFSAELGFGNDSAGGKLFVRRNDPEFLAAFPYGQDAVNSGFSVYLHGL